MAQHCERDRTCYLHNGHEGDHKYLPYPGKGKQVGGDHYQGGTMQPFDVIDAFGLDFYEGSAVKYLLRWRKKNGVEDLEKAKHYIEILIEREKHGN